MLASCACHSSKRPRKDVLGRTERKGGVPRELPLALNDLRRVADEKKRDSDDDVETP